LRKTSDKNIDHPDAMDLDNSVFSDKATTPAGPGMAPSPESRREEKFIRILIPNDRYDQLRGGMIREGGERYGDLSYMLGGRSSYQNHDGSSLDGLIEKWKPNLSVVRTVIKFALKTGRLGPQMQSSILTQNSQRFGI
jgi:hypothetical protein